MIPSMVINDFKDASWVSGIYKYVYNAKPDHISPDRWGMRYEAYTTLDNCTLAMTVMFVKAARNIIHARVSWIGKKYQYLTYLCPQIWKAATASPQKTVNAPVSSVTATL